MLIYALLYLLYIYAITDNIYVASHQSNNLLEMIMTYKLELFLISIAIITLLSTKKNTFISNSLMIGGIITTYVVICVLKLSTTIYPGNYFLCIPTTLALIIIFYHLKSKFLIFILSSFLCIIFIYKDYIIHNSQNGKEYRTICEYLTSNQSDNIPLFIAKHSEHHHSSQWFVKTWSSILKYYFPNKKITIISPQFSQSNPIDIELWNMSPLYYPLIYRENPQSGDFYIIKKTDKYTDDLSVIKDMKHELIYQNKLFEVYKIK